MPKESVKLGKMGPWRHGVVALAGFGSAGLAMAGVVGSGRYEHFEAKQVTIAPAVNGGVRVREVIDYDMARTRRHGYVRNVDNDFGVPTNVRAESPDAPAMLDVSPLGNRTRLRIGDPQQTVDGQHRYVLSYTLPDAQTTSRGLAVDIIGNEDTLVTDRLEVLVVGMNLADPKCSTGAFGAVGGCSLEKTEAGYRAVVSDITPNQGVTIGAAITSIELAEGVSMPPLPDLPARKNSNSVPLAVGMGALNTGLGALVYRTLRRRGRNVVYAGSAADAAFGTSGRATTLVSDDAMDELATTEFAPPKGLQPWEGAVLLSEHITSDSPTLWISGMAGREAIDVDKNGSHLVLRKGKKFNELNADDQNLVELLVGPTGVMETGKYDPMFAAAWKSVQNAQQRRIDASGWWQKGSPRAKGGIGTAVILLVVVGFFLSRRNRPNGSFSVRRTSIPQFVSSPLFAVLAGAALATLAAFGVYHFLLKSRSAEGSALAIRTESFRRFLETSEGQHVEWAWNNGFLREYSGWAVALGATAAWSKALSKANIPEPARASAGPLLLPSLGSSMRSSRTAPSSSGGSGGGGGFSGGSVGGGGGGGSSGGW